jgi:nitrite reductase/ring-hydroxylating ferredoxin subunit/uncharacterized membrane protein
MARTRPTLSVWSHLHHWLEGRPFGHPIHSLLVHLPIGLFTLSFLFDLGGRLAEPENWMVQAAFYTLIAGVLTGVLAALFGVVDWVGMRADHPGRKIANTHMVLNLVVIALYFVNAWLRIGQLDADQTPFLPLALSFVSLAVLYLSGYLGGRMVYDEGVAVGRHRRYGDLPEDTIRVPAPRSPGEFVPVAYTRRFNQSETVRAEVNGYALAIARVGDDYYAVQDYCTHRQGPLSEGRLCDGEIECPWHRSRFDLRTGQVTNGPAKLELKTFPTRVVDGVIQVQVPAEPASHEQAEQAAERQRTGSERANA